MTKNQAFFACKMYATGSFAGKYYLQTFFIKPLDLLVAFVHERKTADAMVSEMNVLEKSCSDAACSRNTCT